MRRIRVVIIDGHTLFRAGMAMFFSKEGDIDVVGETSDGGQGVLLTRSQTPDVVIMDSKLATRGGADLLREIRNKNPGIAFCLLASYYDDAELLDALKSGAAAFYTKDIAPEELVTAVRRIAAGEYLINDIVLTNPKVARRVLSLFHEFYQSGGSEVDRFMAPLTPRETEILELIATGNSNKEIARYLSISDQTVKNHISSIMRKLAANDRTHAVVLGLRYGLIRVD